MSFITKTWTPNPYFYDFGRPFPYRHVVSLFQKSKAIQDFKDIGSINVYEPGAGTGRIIIPLACEFSNWNFTVVDASASMLDVLSQRVVCESLKNLVIKEADVLEFSPTCKFDLVIISSLLHSIKEWRQLLLSLINSLSTYGVICLIGEEGEIYNQALARSSIIFPTSEIDKKLIFFWQQYLNARHEVEAPSTEQSQIGCQWEINNEMSVSELKKLGFKEVCTTEIRWSHWLRVQDLFRIVEERCYSSMFTVEPLIYENLLSILKNRCSSLNLDTFVESKHIAVARFLKR